MSIPSTLQIETDVDLNLNPMEFIAYNYKGDCQYYSTSDLQALSSGILPIVVYPSVAPEDTSNLWPNFSYTFSGTEEKPNDIDPTKPWNGGNTPEGWTSFSGKVNDHLKLFTKNGKKGALLPQSNYMKELRANNPSSTVSLYCGFYDQKVPEHYVTKCSISDSYTFYVLTVQISIS